MSTLFKIRISDVAKDFGVANKEIMTILSKNATPPRSPAKVLSVSELNTIFNTITLDNQVADIEVALQQISKTSEEAPKETQKSEPKEQVSQETVKPAESKSERAKKTGPKERPAAGQTQRPKRSPAASTERPAAQRTAAPSDGGPPQTDVATRKGATSTRRRPERRYVDTRIASVDMSKYDERAEKLVPDRAQNVDNVRGREKIKRSPDRRTQNIGQKRRMEEQEKLRKLQMEVRKKAVLKVLIPDEIAVGELALRLKKTGADVVKNLMKLGVMASVSDIIDFDTASLVAMEYGAKIEREVHMTIEERLIVPRIDEESELLPRDPVVVVMGHVDHGKTSLLDAIRETDVAAGEAGGITQHIGAYQVRLNERTITFLDTPGHAAFTSMRARGASVTDVAILVVAADDGVMPQTIEAINHARAAEVPIIVAINKMDKPTADPDRVMRELTEQNLLPEEWGGDTIVSKVSAIKGEGIADLLEMVLLVADMRELRANPNRDALGTVVEAKLDRARGSVSTLLIQNGTLKVGDLVIAGSSVGRVRAMTDYKGKKITSAGPSMPVEITGFDETPGAGERFNVITDERMARELALERRRQERDAQNEPTSKMTLTDIFEQIKQGNVKSLNIILKADVQGSVEALKKSLEELSNEEVKVDIIHSGVGAVNESDVMLASASDAIIVGFNVRPDINTRNSAEQKGIDIRLYRVIYECIDEIKAAMKGLLAPKYKEELLGTAEIRQVFKVTGSGTVAGCMVKDGKMQRAAKVRIVRDGVVIHEGDISSLRRFKDDVREVATGYECGISIEDYPDIKEGDIIESYNMVVV